MTTARDVAEALHARINAAPAGGVFHGAVTGPVRTLSETDSGVQVESTFPVFFRAGEEYDVTVRAK